MKGQYRVLLEIVFILLGILITGYVLSTFKTLQDKTNEATVEDNINAVADSALTALIKVYTTDNSIVRFNVPEKISEHTYKILLDGDNNRLVVISVKNRAINSTRQIFNIPANRINKSEVYSSSVIIEAINQGGVIGIRRAPGNQRSTNS